MVNGTVELGCADRSVLLTGDGPELPGAVHQLLAAGARVDVAAGSATTSLQDLAERDLIRLVDEPQLADYDLVVPAASLRSAGAEPPARRTAVASVVSDSGCACGLSRIIGTVEAAPQTAEERRDTGEVVLVGGGPGDPSLLTMAALAELQAGDVIIYDRLAPLSALSRAKPGAELIDVGKIPRGRHTPQERINELLVDRARAGHRVVRFKGGDNFVFGRGGEEALACAAAGIPVRIVPGISSSLAAPALAGIPVTHRSLTQGFTVVTGHVRPGHPSSSVDWAALARTGTTLVVLMGVQALPDIVEELMRAGMPADTAAATIADAALPSMRVVRSTVGGLVEAVTAAGLGAPAVTVIGAVAELDVLYGDIAAARSTVAV